MRFLKNIQDNFKNISDNRLLYGKNCLYWIFISIGPTGEQITNPSYRRNKTTRIL